MVQVLTNELLEHSEQTLTIIAPVDGKHDGLVVKFSPDAITSNDLVAFQKATTPGDDGAAMHDTEAAAAMLVAFRIKWNLRRMVPAEGTFSPIITDTAGNRWKADANGVPLTEPVRVTVDEIQEHVGVKTLGLIAEKLFEALNPKAENAAS